MTTPLSMQEGAVAFGGRPVLRGINLSIGSGEVLALLGSNGSGKSTLVRAALGLIPLARGEVRLFGTPLARFEEWQRVGYVPQRITASPGVPATVWEVVASGRLSRRRRFQPLRREDRIAIEDALEAVGLSHRRHDGAAQLSGGQQQRILIARALAGEPDLFVMDEPTAGVDAATQLAFADALSRVASSGATIVLVAHELGPLESLIDRSVVVEGGRIVYDGRPQPSANSLRSLHEHAHPETASGPAILDEGWHW